MGEVAEMYEGLSLPLQYKEHLRGRAAKRVINIY